jgi:hypothetical protein
MRVRTGFDRFNRDRWRAVMNAVMSPKERDHSEDQGVDERMGSEWILGRLDRGEY